MGAICPSRTVAVIGAGTMGAGIALVAARAGHDVLLHDAAPGASERGLVNLGALLARDVERERISRDEADRQLARIRPAATIADLAPAALVIEAIVEDIAIKASVLRAVEDVVAPDAIIASNTSSLSITALAARLARPERVAGMHFFNPAPVLALVEAVAGHATDPAVVDIVADTARAWGKVPVRCGSTPGFIVNRIARPFYGEAWRLLEEGVADAATIDALLTGGGGFRMGPFALMDMIGHDVNFAVTRSVHDAMFHDPRYRPSLAQQQLVDAGWLGRKSGRGVFDYRPGSAPTLPAVEGTELPPLSVSIADGDGPAATLPALVEASGVRSAKAEGPRTDGAIDLGHARLMLTDGRTATQRSHDNGGVPTICFDLCRDYGTATHIALAASDGCPPGALAQAVGLFQAMGKQVCVIDDAPGLVVFRTLAMIINEAADARHRNVASGTDIDLSMTRGVNYPQGPLAWSDEIGTARVARVLTHLSDHYREDRYRASPLLSRAALNGSRLSTDAIQQARP